MLNEPVEFSKYPRIHKILLYFPIPLLIWVLLDVFFFKIAFFQNFQTQERIIVVANILHAIPTFIILTTSDGKETIAHFKKIGRGYITYRSLAIFFSIIIFFQYYFNGSLK